MRDCIWALLEPSVLSSQFFLDSIFVNSPICEIYLASLVAQMVKNPPCNVGDLGSIPELGTSPGGGNDNPLQNSCLENLHG